MRVPLSWLRDYVDVELDADALAETLTMLGLEITGIERRGADWRGVVVGELLGVRPHPRADRLSLALVTTGEGEPLSIVCGAANIAVGQRVPVALPGAVLPGERSIAVSRIAGEESHGMLCSGDELGLTADAEGILILPAGTSLGRPLTELYGDVVLDVDVKANRGDALSLVGLAREIAAATGGEVRWPAIELAEAGTPCEAHLKVEVSDTRLCHRFVGRYLDGVRVAPSPDRIQMRLIAAGVRPVSNVVDASNYVMLEMGKPIHTFDAARVSGGRIVVRTAEPGERLETLDHVDRELTPETLLIADPTGPLAIAGVMGGAASEVSEATGAVVVESAIFDPVSIRRTARHYGLPSEASLRFEKGQEWRLAPLGADRTCQLVAAWAGGRIAPGRVDSAPREEPVRRVAIRPARINRLLGTGLTGDEMRGLLDRFGIVTEPAVGGDVVPVTGAEDGVTLDKPAAQEALVTTIPSWRADLVIEADLAEEVARLHGYGGIPSRRPETPMPPYRPDPRAGVDRVRTFLAGAGLTEVVTHALIAPHDLALVAIDDGDGRAIHVTNPLSHDHSVLRRSMLPGLLRALSRNERVRRGDVALFEVGEVHEREEARPREAPRLAILLAGELEPPAWDRPARSADAWDLRGIVEALLSELGAPAPRYAARVPLVDVEHPGRTADLHLGADPTPAGVVGELHPRLLEAFGIRAERVAYTELGLTALLAAAPATRRYRPLPHQPAAERDLAAVVPEAVLAGDVAERIRAAAGPALVGLALFDVYRGAPLGAGEKSLAYRLHLDSGNERRPPDGVMEAVHRALQGAGWRLRA